MHEHEQEVFKGFTSRYHIHTLVYFEVYGDIHTAIHREKRLKKYKRSAKIALIEAKNPEWKNLFRS